MAQRDEVSYLLTKEKYGKTYYLSIQDVDKPKPYLRFTTRIIDGTLFGKNVNIHEYFRDKFGLNAMEFDNLKLVAKYLTHEEIAELADKYL